MEVGPAEGLAEAEPAVGWRHDEAGVAVVGGATGVVGLWRGVGLVLEHT